MKLYLKGDGVYWYDFIQEGIHYHGSTHARSECLALSIAYGSLAFLQSPGEVIEFSGDYDPFDDPIVRTLLASLANRMRLQRPKINLLRKKSTPSSRVYLMRDNRNGRIKIGAASSERFREKTLQSEVPEIELLFAFEGNVQLERRLHEFFKAKRCRGEWYLLTADDIQWIRERYYESPSILLPTKGELVESALLPKTESPQVVRSGR